MLIIHSLWKTLWKTPCINIHHFCINIHPLHKYTFCTKNPYTVALYQFWYTLKIRIIPDKNSSLLQVKSKIHRILDNLRNCKLQYHILQYRKSAREPENPHNSWQNQTFRLIYKPHPDLEICKMQDVSPAYYILNPEITNCGHSYHQPPVDIQNPDAATPTRPRHATACIASSLPISARPRDTLYAQHKRLRIRAYYIYIILLQLIWFSIIYKAI